MAHRRWGVPPTIFYKGGQKLLTRHAKAYEFLFADCLSLSPTSSSQFTLELRGPAENCKKTKSFVFGVQSFSKSLMLIRLKSSSLVFVVIGSIISTPICNHFYGRLSNNGKITTFRRYCSLMPSCTIFLEPRRSRLGPLKSMFNAENFVSSLSLSICSKFGLLTKNHKFFPLPSHLVLLLGVTSFEFIDLWIGDPSLHRF